MINQEAFTYCWTDHRNNMLYVGYHKGRQDDGYVCSSKWMLEEYKKRPQDFTRMILAEGTQGDCVALEASILKSVDAKHNPEYYNQQNGDGKFIRKFCKKETRKLLSEINIGKKRTVESCKKQSKTMSGEGNHMYGKKRPEQSLRLKGNKYGLGNKNMLGHKHTEETLTKMRKPHGPFTAEHNKKISIALKGKPKSKIACPCCGKIVDAANMKRWHNNCKLKKN